MSERTRDDLIARVEALERELAARDRQLVALRAVIDESPDVMLIKDHEGNFQICNRTVASLYGTTPEAMVGKHDGDFSATPEQAEFFRQNVLGIMARGETEIVFEDTTDEKTGEVRHFKSIKKPFRGPDGLPQILVIAHDITDVLRAQARVAESEQRLQYVLAATGEGVWDWDLRTNALQHNQRWYSILGFGEDELTGTVHDFERCLVDEDRETVMAALEATLRGEGPYHHEHAMRRRDGRVIRVLDRGDVVERAPDGRPLRMVGSFTDITPQVEARELVTRSLREKETLLKEVHHRVKNNLQIISSLLTLQADAASPEVTQQLLESAARVRSMALIHQQLYIANDLAHIQFGDYARTLATELLASLSSDATLTVEADRVELTVEQAVPCGLVLNELMTNALKHGRAADGTLTVCVEVRQVERGITISVQDRGPGLPADLAARESSSLGMKLVRSLTRQLRGRLDVGSAGGTRMSLWVGSTSREV